MSATQVRSNGPQLAEVGRLFHDKQIRLTIGKERAKLTVKLDDFMPYSFNSLDHNGNPAWTSFVVEGSVSIYGTTDAFIEKTGCFACIGEERSKNGSNNPVSQMLDLPSVIQAKSEPVKFRAFVMKEGDPQPDDEAWMLFADMNNTFTALASFVISMTSDRRGSATLARCMCFFGARK